MSGKRTLVMGLLVVFFFGILSFASTLELTLAKSQECDLAAGKAQSFLVTLSDGDFVQIKLEPKGQKLTIISYSPSGKRLRGSVVGPGDGRLMFIAAGTGAHRIEVAANDGGVASDVDAKKPCSITLEKIVNLATRMAPLKPAYESPRMRALRESVERGDKTSINAFWEEIKKSGAPLIEPLADDNKNMLVTFVWRGTPETRNVMVLRIPQIAIRPEDYLMIRLGDTDVWYRTVKIAKGTRFAYTLATNVPPSVGTVPDIDQNAITMAATAAILDPLNPKRYRVDPHSLDAPEYVGNSIFEMPDAPAQPWSTERTGVPTGRIEKHTFKSTLLKNERDVAVYLPPGYSTGAKPYPLLVVFDKHAYLGDENQTALVPTPTILDNLISEKRIAPMVALFLGNVNRDSELGCNPVFSDVLASELVPWVHGLYSVTSDPHQTVIAGSSRGGLASTCAALRHPETFGNVLSQSGSFFITPAGSNFAQSDTNPENWIAKQFIVSPKLPVRFYLDAGSDEIDYGDGLNSILVTNRTLRDVLLAKGYDVHFQGLIFLIGEK